MVEGYDATYLHYNTSYHSLYFVNPRFLGGVFEAYTSENGAGYQEDGTLRINFTFNSAMPSGPVHGPTVVIVYDPVSDMILDYESTTVDDEKIDLTEQEQLDAARVLNQILVDAAAYHAKKQR